MTSVVTKRSLSLNPGRLVMASSEGWKAGSRHYRGDQDCEKWERSSMHTHHLNRGARDISRTLSSIPSTHTVVVKPSLLCNMMGTPWWKYEEHTHLLWVLRCMWYVAVVIRRSGISTRTLSQARCIKQTREADGSFFCDTEEVSEMFLSCLRSRPCTTRACSVS